MFREPPFHLFTRSSRHSLDGRRVRCALVTIRFYMDICEHQPCARFTLPQPAEACASIISLLPIYRSTLRFIMIERIRLPCRRVRARAFGLISSLQRRINRKIEWRRGRCDGRLRLAWYAIRKEGEGRANSEPTQPIKTLYSLRSNCLNG